MKLKDIYKKVVEHGQKNDPRGLKGVSAELERIKAVYEDMPSRAKKEFDQERFTNPYADTRILHGDPETNVKNVLIGIDMEVGEVLLADRLREKGQKIDLIIAHHPEGKAHAIFFNVMYMQADIWNKHGVPINIAEGILEDRVREVERRVMPANHNRAIDAAKLLDIPFMCAHTPADNCVSSYLQDLFEKKNPVTVGDIVKIIEDIPEYKHEMGNNSIPKIVAGKDKSRAGKVFVDMTGGTEGPEKMFQAFANAGIGTVICMHLSEKHIQEASKNNINVIIAGHIASDNLGLNLLLDEVTKGEKLNIVCCSGFFRVERK